MTSRSTQTRQLAQLLSKRTGTTVTIEWHGTRTKDGRHGGWYVQWANGPTYATMRGHIAELAPRVPAVRIDQLSYYRSHDELTLAILLLRHLDQHPDQVHGVRGQEAEHLHWDADYPEKADDLTRQRAAALLRLDQWQRLTTETLHRLAEHARPDWVAALAWLDALVDAETNPTVTKLADYRARRQTDDR